MNSKSYLAFLPELKAVLYFYTVQKKVIPDNIKISFDLKFWHTYTLYNYLTKSILKSELCPNLNLCPPRHVKRTTRTVLTHAVTPFDRVHEGYTTCSKYSLFEWIDELRHITFMNSSMSNLNFYATAIIVSCIILLRLISD